MLEIRNLTKHYGKKVALRDFSYTFTKGVYGLLGPNGSGKSTFMNTVTDCLSATSGEVVFDGTDIRKLKGEYRKHYGYLPQNVGLYSNMTAYENLKYFCSLRDVPKDKMEERITYSLEAVNLLSHKDEKVSSYSGGMKRRLTIAVTILADPEILIFDEPTVGLDPRERHRFKELITSIAKDKIVILSSHIVSDIVETADYVLFLKEGNLVYQSENKDIDLNKMYLEYFPDTE